MSVDFDSTAYVVQVDDIRAKSRLKIIQMDDRQIQNRVVW